MLSAIISFLQVELVDVQQTAEPGRKVTMVIGKLSPSWAIFDVDQQVDQRQQQITTDSDRTRHTPPASVVHCTPCGCGCGTIPGRCQKRPARSRAFGNCTSGSTSCSLQKVFPPDFLQHLPRRVAVGGNHRHADGERFAQDQRVVVHAGAEHQRVHFVQRAHQLCALSVSNPWFTTLAPSNGREFAEGVQLNLCRQRHHVAHQLLVGFPVVTQVMRDDRDFRLCPRSRHRASGRPEIAFRRHVDAVVDDLAAPCPVQAVERHPPRAGSGR